MLWGAIKPLFSPWMFSHHCFIDRCLMYLKSSQGLTSIGWFQTSATSRISSVKYKANVSPLECLWYQVRLQIKGSVQDAQQGFCCGVKQMTQVSSDRFSVSYSNHHLELIGILGHIYVVWVGSTQVCGFDSTWQGYSLHWALNRTVELCFEVKFLLNNYYEPQAKINIFSPSN